MFLHYFGKNFTVFFLVKHAIRGSKNPEEKIRSKLSNEF